MTETNPSHQAALFLQLLLGLQQGGMMALGKLMNPITRKLEKNMDAARDTIDTLTAIEARTRGNLEPDEERVLRQILTELRMNYVDEIKRGAVDETKRVAADQTKRGGEDEIKRGGNGEAAKE